MDANLMRASGLQTKNQFGVFRETLAHGVVRDRRSSCSDDREFGAVTWVAPNRTFDRPLPMWRHAADQPQVFAFDATRFHGGREFAEALVALCDDQQAGRIAVEAMDKAGS